LTEHPDVTFDLWDLFHFDVEEVFAGRRAVEWAYGLIERLLDEPWSRYRARLLGGDKWREHLGWTPDTYTAVLLVDALQVNTSVTAYHGSGKKPKLPQPVPRPLLQDVDPEQLSDEDLAALARELDM